jgi:hypothetical protein
VSALTPFQLYCLLVLLNLLVIAGALLVAIVLRTAVPRVARWALLDEQE